MNKRRIAVISLIALVVLAVIGWNGYGWWLKHKLERYKSELAARGEKLTVAELMKDYKTPEHNSASLLRRAFTLNYRDGVANTNAPSTMRMIAPGKAMVGWQQPRLIDYSGKATNTWEELADDLERSREAIELLHQMVEHPALDFGLDYSQGFALMLPHLAPIKSAAQTLSAAAMLELHRGNAPAAAQHLRAALALSKGLEDERLLISHLVRIAITQITINACWELVQSPNAIEADLKLIQSDLEALDFVAGMRNSFEMERAMGAMTIRHLRDNGGIYDMFSFGGATPPTATTTTELVKEKAEQYFSPREIQKTSNELLWQSALSYEDELRGAQGLQVLIEACRALEANQPSALALADAVSELEVLGQLGSDELFWPGDDDLSLTAIRDAFGRSSRSLLKALNKVQFIETSRALAVTTIALKRYQIRHGSLPSELDALVPEFLPAIPRDPVDGKALRYQLNADGSFLLYSVGEDGVDDGGDASRATKSSSANHSVMFGRDWVWPQPATPEEIEIHEQRAPSRN